MSQSILTNTTIASAGRIINLVLGIGITAAVTRLLGAAGYGVYALLVSYGMLLQTAADFGLYLTLTREVGRYPDKEHNLLSLISSLRLVLLVGLLGGGAIIALAVPAYRSLVPAFLIIALGLIAQSLSQLLMGIYQTHGTVWRATLGDFVGRLVQLAGVLSFLLIATPYSLQPTTSLVYMIAMFTLGTVTAYLFHVVLLPTRRAWQWQFSGEQWKRLIRTSWPLGALLIINIIYFRADILMLSYFRSSTEVGWYGLAYAVVERGLFFPAMFGGLLLPRLSRALRQGREQARALLEQSLHFWVIPAALLATILAVYARPLVVFLSGEEFAPAGPLLQVLTLALLVMFFGNVFGFVLVALEKQKQLLLLYGILAVGNIIGNLLLIPRYGAAAAAWTTVVTEAAASVTAAVITWRALAYRLPTQPVVIAAFLAAATVLVALSLPTAWHVVLRSAVASAFYLLGAYLTGMLRRSDIALLTSRT